MRSHAQIELNPARAVTRYRKGISPGECNGRWSVNPIKPRYQTWSPTCVEFPSLTWAWVIRNRCSECLSCQGRQHLWVLLREALWGVLKHLDWRPVSQGTRMAASIHHGPSRSRVCCRVLCPEIGAIHHADNASSLAHNNRSWGPKQEDAHDKNTDWFFKSSEWVKTLYKNSERLVYIFSLSSLFEKCMNYENNGNDIYLSKDIYNFIII